MLRARLVFCSGTGECIAEACLKDGLIFLLGRCSGALPHFTMPPKDAGRVESVVVNVGAQRGVLHYLTFFCL